MSDPATFKSAMRKLASGVSIIATIADGRPHGFAATAVTSVAADPPTILICVNRNVSCHDVILQAGIFCINLLAEGDAEIAQRFSRAEDRHKRFETCDWQPLTTGAPCLKAAIAAFDCVVASTLLIHTHTIFVAHVVDLAVPNAADAPLIYADGCFNTLLSSRVRA